MTIQFLRLENAQKMPWWLPGGARSREPVARAPRFKPAAPPTTHSAGSWHPKRPPGKPAARMVPRLRCARPHRIALRHSNRQRLRTAHSRANMCISEVQDVRSRVVIGESSAAPGRRLLSSGPMEASAQILCVRAHMHTCHR